MRYINLRRIRVPQEWINKASEAQRAVNDRGADPNDYGPVWRELKDKLAEASDDKCWYCETKIDRSDNAVDHYRPKKRVQDADREHLGYRWLAFSKSNFRYSCTKCNCIRISKRGDTRGGKADYFPLLEEGNRAYHPGEEENETPLLLDPCKIFDWKLLGCFEESGEPYCNSEAEFDKRKVDESIRLLHLDEEGLCQKRYNKCLDLKRLIDDGQRIYLALKTQPDREADLERVLDDIYAIIDSSAEYSGELRILLMNKRHEDHPWIEEILAA